MIDQKANRVLQVGVVVLTLWFGSRAMAGDAPAVGAPNPEPSVRSKTYFLIFPPGLLQFDGQGDRCTWLVAFLIPETGTYTETGGDPSIWSATTYRTISTPYPVYWQGVQFGPFLTGTQTFDFTLPVLGIGF